MKKIVSLLLVFMLPVLAYSQPKYSISGYITDKNTGEVLIGAIISEKTLMKGAVTNDYGFFSLSLPQGKHSFICSYLGYNSFRFDFDLQSNTIKNIHLEEKSTDVKEIVITADYSKTPIQTNEYEVENFTIKSIRQLPTLFGEADLIKAVQLQPGVKILGDGSSGMFIRGGNSDQNLILIDEAPIYNPSHMFGLISIFNSDALNNVTLYKSNMPAQYGGRASAVLDCKMKEGNLFKYNYSAGISPFSLSLYATGPLIKEKSAFLIAVRKSVVDIFFSPQMNGMLDIVPSYYDINVKLNTKIGNKDRLFVSLYKGKDRLRSVEGIDNEWSNLCGTLRWNRSFSSRWFSNVSLIYSNYTNNLIYTQNGRNYEWHTGVKDLNIKFDISWYLSPNNSIKFGGNSIYHQFIPGESGDTSQSISRVQAFEHAAFVLNDIKIFSWLGLNYGIRLSNFQNTGKAKWFDYDEDHNPVNINTNETGVYNSTINWEPRISANISFNSSNSIKLAFARNAQYMQILQNSSLSYTSLETWFPANPNIEPILADVFSAGWFHEIGQQYFFSAEAYYKYFRNRIDYVDHAVLTDNPFIEAEIRSGKEKAYGLEVELKKNKGKFTGNISYTYSRVLRQIEEINDGEEYPSPYDLPHDFRITGNYILNEYWSMTAIWMFTSGRPATLPIGFYYEDWDPVPIYSDRNSTRFPNYHRLDIAANYTTKPKNKRLFWDFGFGIYNLYNRQNPIGYKFTAFNEIIEVKQYSLFKVMPSFSIKLNF